MESNYGAPMPADQRQRQWQRQWQPVSGLGVAASVLIGLVALADVLQTVAAANALRQQEIMFGVWYFLALLAAAVVFMIWLWRARSNVELAAGPRSQRLGRGWAVGGWICPIVNLWFPYQYLVDVWRASAPRDTADGLVLAWWLAYLASNVVARFGSLDDDHSIGLVSCLLDVLAAVGAVLVVRRISEWQSVARG